MSVTARGSLSSVEIAERLGLFPPTDEQRQIIEADPHRPMLVVAGAGSGKTETMSNRVVWLVANGHVQPDQVLGLTFTRKAAGQLAERVARQLRALRATGLWQPEQDADGTLGLSDTPTVLTYHSYAGRLVREQGLRLGIEPDARMLTEAAAWQYAAEVVERYDGPMDDVERAVSTVTGAVVALAGEMSEHLLTPHLVREELDAILAGLDDLADTARLKKDRNPDFKDLAATVRARRAVLPLVEQYQALKRSRASLDFADQMGLAAELARRFHGVGRLERRRYRAVLLDEFQDTSEAQLQLLKHLFVADAEPVRVTAVGDPHQSIYGWRGASATTLGSFPTHFADEAGVAPVRPLSTSWRNDRSILAAANVVAAPLRHDSPVEVPPLVPSPAASDGRLFAARLHTIEDEAAHVAAWLAERWHPDADGRYPSSAVLCRKRSLFPIIIDALEQAGLPVEVVGVGGLLMTPEVVDLVSLLWVVQDPTRGDRLMRLLTGPSVRLGAADLDVLAAWSRRLERLHRVEVDRVDTDREPETRDRPSLVEALDQLPPPTFIGPGGSSLSDLARQRLSGLSGAIRSLRRLSGLPLADLAGEAERALGLDIEVLSRAAITPQAARVHLDAFADVAMHFSASADRPTLAGFLSWLDAAQEEERGLDKAEIESSDAAIQVLTIHAAKGLEWHYVAVPGLTETIFPDHCRKPSFNQEADGWGIGPGSDPNDRSTWVVEHSGWTSGLPGVPYDLRGDSDGLPSLPIGELGDLAGLKEELKRFRVAAGEHELREERRLAYVALTRAKHEMLMTSSVWFSGSRFRLPSRFLSDVVDAGLVQVDPEAATPEPDAVNPRLVDGRSVVWPDDPLQRRREMLLEGREHVLAALKEMSAPTAPDLIGALAVDGPFSEGERRRRRELRDLLHERAVATGRRTAQVRLPDHLSASAVVALATDPERFAAQLRRPMPSPPAYAARRGTAFHAWVEEHYARAALVDIDELPGFADLEADHDADLETMKRNFLASPWAARTPIAIEVPLETWVAGVSVRGRIDAVFEDRDRYVIVDWKTGRPPSGLAGSARVLQLAAYRLAYARLRSIPVDQVRVAFFYAATGETIWPDLPEDDAIDRLIESIPLQE